MAEKQRHAGKTGASKTGDVVDALRAIAGPDAVPAVLSFFKWPDGQVPGVPNGRRDVRALEFFLRSTIAAASKPLPQEQRAEIARLQEKS